MTVNKVILPTIASLLLLTSCSNNKPIKSGTKVPIQVKAQQLAEHASVAGNYVSNDYAERAKGYDWVAAMITEERGDKIHIKIRSRTDTKKATCTLDAVANKLKPNVYRAELKYGNVLFSFSENALNVTPEQPKDETAVYFYCSGGGSLKGSYIKINEPIDTTGNKRNSPKK